MTLIYKILFAGAVLLSVFLAGCLPASPGNEKGNVTITVYGFSIMKEALDKEIYPAFRAKWQREHGQDVEFVSSYAGSETVTNQILQGAPAEIAILSIERDAERLKAGNATTSDWHTLPNKGISKQNPFRDPRQKRQSERHKRFFRSGKSRH
jgi:ABC-type sulfate transport system substrate-binding protein